MFKYADRVVLFRRAFRKILKPESFLVEKNCKVENLTEMDEITKGHIKIKTRFIFDKFRNSARLSDL